MRWLLDTIAVRQVFTDVLLRTIAMLNPPSNDARAKRAVVTNRVLAHKLHELADDYDPRPAKQWVFDVIAEERQRIADKLTAVPDEVYPIDVFGGPLSTDESRQANELLKDEGLPTFDRVGANAMRHAYRMAARLVREQED